MRKLLTLLMFSKRESLMRSFAKQQALLLIFGLFFAFTSLLYMRKLEHKVEIAKLKNEITLAIERKSENLRAWHFLGLNEAIEQEISILKKSFPISSVHFFSKDELPLVLQENEIQISLNNDPYLDIYIISQFQAISTLIETVRDPNTYISFLAI